MALVFLATVCGCERSTEPTASNLGRITIQVNIDDEDAPWTLTGPTYEDSSRGDTVLDDMAPGDYTICWKSDSVYITPPSKEKTLRAGDSITFNGDYIPARTIIIDPDPDSLSATWTLTGPENFSQVSTGDTTLQNMLPGTFAIAWGSVQGWITPAGGQQTLAEGDTIDFSGAYLELLDGFVLIPAGTFWMGAPEGESGADSDESRHQVTLTHSFYRQNTEVTNQQYMELAQWAVDHGYATATSASLRDALDGSTVWLLDLDDSDCEIDYSGGFFTCVNPEHPVKEVTWYGAAAYCDWLSLQAVLPRAYDHSTWQCNGNSPYTAAGYRLPTEAEWEYACRAGTTTPFNTGDCLDAGTEANYDGEYPYMDCPSGPCVGRTVPVGSYPPNAWGLYDMHGNVWEWCNDWYGNYHTASVSDPGGPPSDLYRVVRSGVFNWEAGWCRSAHRGFFPPGGLDYDVPFGFRPVRSAD